MTEQVTVEHEATRRRFVVRLDGTEAVLEYSPVGSHTLDLSHTYVPPPFRGRGIASQLASHALRYAADHGYRVIASCPFVARYVAAAPEGGIAAEAAPTDPSLSRRGRPKGP